VRAYPPGKLTALTTASAFRNRLASTKGCDGVQSL
jgi:hypothetical protein